MTDQTSKQIESLLILYQKQDIIFSIKAREHIKEFIINKLQEQARQIFEDIENNRVSFFYEIKYKKLKQKWVKK